MIGKHVIDKPISYLNSYTNKQLPMPARTQSYSISPLPSQWPIEAQRIDGYRFCCHFEKEGVAHIPES